MPRLSLRRVGPAALVPIVFFMTTADAVGQNRGFTFQGQLKQDGVPVDESCAMQFYLWSDPISTNVADRLGPPVLYGTSSPLRDGPAIDVIDGLFEAHLPFSEQFLTGQRLWLEIRIGCPDTEGLSTTLSPRQPITGSPYSLSTRGMVVDLNGDIGIGTDAPEADMHFRSTGSLQLRLEADTNNSGKGDHPSIVMSQDGGIVGAHVGFTGGQNDLSLRTSRTDGGESHLRLVPSGNVGVGAETGLGFGKLVVGQDDDTVNGGVSIFDAAGSQSLRLWVDPSDVRRIDGGASGQATVAINGSGVGRVGIGTTNPTSPLHLANIGNWSNGVGDGWGDFSLNNGNVGLSFGVATGGGGTGDVRIWATGGTERMFLGSATNGIALTISGNRNVGIGTTSPEKRLHVLSGSAGSVTAHSSSVLVVENDTTAFINILSPTTDHSGVLFGNPSSNAAGGILYNHTATPDGLQFRTNGNTTRMVIDADGDVGIGTTAPASDLHLVSSGSLQIRLEADTNNSGESDQPTIVMTQDGGVIAGAVGFFDQQNSMSLRTDDSGPGASHLLLLPEGNVGVGTSAPSQKLHVDGNLRVEGDIVTPTRVGHVSLSPAAFQDFGNTRFIDSLGRPMIANNLNSLPFSAIANVHLPHGATVTGLSASLDDRAGAVDENAFVRLRRVRTASTLFLGDQLASVETFGNGEQVRSTAAIADAVVDNANYTYCVEFANGSAMPSDSIRLRGVTIEYDVTRVLP